MADGTMIFLALAVIAWLALLGIAWLLCYAAARAEASDPAVSVNPLRVEGRSPIRNA